MLTDRRIHATIPAADLGRARRWYEERLGFTPIRELPGGLMYDAAEELKARGVVFEDYDFPTLKTVDSIATTGPSRAAWFRDSEGNIIGIVQLPTE